MSASWQDVGMLLKRPAGRLLGLAGATMILAGVALVGLLHLQQPSVGPVRRTISEYALGDHTWVFNAAVLLVAAGSIATSLALARAGLLRPASLASVALALWCAGLAGVVVFPKHNWAIGPSMSGELHRGLSLAAFVSLPLAAILVGCEWRRSWWGRSSILLGVVSLLVFAPIPIAYVAEPYTGVHWWRAMPLGLVERGLALSEVVAVLVLALWATAAGPSPLRLCPTRGVDDTRDRADQFRIPSTSGGS
jgi:hypothetical membrane protein